MNQLRGAWQDPLNKQEIINATAVALNDTPPAQRTDSGSYTSADPHKNIRSSQAHDSVTPAELHPLGTQVLLIELKEQKRPATLAGRVAEVFIFDYQQGVARLSLIDVEQNTLIHQQELSSVHLPLSDAEISYSQSLMWNNTEIRRQIEHEVIAANLILADNVDQPLSELQTRVSIWAPDSLAQSGGSNCASERCALISIFTIDNYNFSIEPVVNLMNGRVYSDLIK